MEVLSGPLFALIFLIHNTFPNRERTDSDRALCMWCENVHHPVSEWDFVFPLAHAQVSQCKRITLHTMSKLCMDLRLDRYITGTELTGWSRSHIICHIHTLHTDPAHHVLNGRDGYTHIYSWGTLRCNALSTQVYIVKLLPFLLQPICHNTPTVESSMKSLWPLSLIVDVQHM